MSRISNLIGKMQSVDENKIYKPGKPVELKEGKEYKVSYGSNKATVKTKGSKWEATATNGKETKTFVSDVSPQSAVATALAMVGFKIQASGIASDLEKQ